MAHFLVDFIRKVALIFFSAQLVSVVDSNQTFSKSPVTFSFLIQFAFVSSPYFGNNVKNIAR